MSRIRTIKPEFCVSEQLSDCSPSARLVFALMWMFCDDQGIHPAKVKKLRGEVFPLDDDITTSMVAAWVSELLAVDLLHEYEVSGERYWIITGWAKHQKIDKPTSKYPLPLTDESQPPPRVLAEPSPPEGKGREGKGDKTPQAQAAAKVETPPGENPAVVRIAALRRVCVAGRVRCDTAQANMHLGQWATEGLTDQQLTDAITLARKHKPDPAVIPIRYLLGIVSDLVAGRIKPEEPRGADAVAGAMASIAAKEAARERAESPEAPVVPEAPVADPQTPASPAFAESSDLDEDEWWTDTDRLIQRGNQEGVVNVPGQDFGEYIARVLAAAGPGPWEDAQPPDVLERITHWRTRGVNPPRPQQDQRAQPVRTG